MAGGYSVDIDTATHRKAFSRALLTLLLLTLPLPIHSQGQFCPGERVSSFSCTTDIAHVWAGSALDDQCPFNNPSDGISLSTAANLEGNTPSCGIFTANVTNITPASLLSSTISFTASSSLNRTEVVCRDNNQADVERYPITIIAVGRVGNLRRSGPDTIQWDPPSGAAGCISSYIVDDLLGGSITVPADSRMISLSDLGLDTCDSSLRITVTAEVPNIGVVESSVSDPFDPTSAFQPAAQEVDIVGPPTYAITDDSTVIQITIIASEVLDLFPDTFITVSYSGSSCGGSSRVMDNVTQVNISCLEENNVDFTAVLVDHPDCSSNINLPQQSFPLINQGLQATVMMTSNSATVSFPMSTVVRVEGGSFNVVGTATRVNVGTMVNSDPAIYPANAVFSNLESNVSYEFAIEIISNASDRTVIGRFSITQSTPPNIAAIVGGVVGGIAAVAVVVVVLVCLCYCRKKSKGSGGKPMDERELRERTRSAEAPPHEETAPTYADPSMIGRQPASDSQDVYTMVDKAKKAPKPEDQLQTYQAPESIKREAPPATGELYTVPEMKKGSKKKEEATPAEYTEVDMKKKHQPPSGLLYSELKTPPSKPVEYTDIQPHS